MSKNIEEYTYLEHLSQLKKKLVIIFIILIAFFIISYYFNNIIYKILLDPLDKIYSLQGKELSLIYTALPEAFIANIKISLFVATLLTLPLAFLQIYQFISPALKAQEVNIFKLIFISSPLLFFIGVSVAYFFVIPLAYKFFLGFEVSQGDTVVISMLPKLSEYLSISIKIILAFAICFQIPVILFILLALGIISVETLKQGRKYMIVFVFILSAIFTPPDPLSQVLLALSLILLYEFSIILFKKTIKNKTS